MSNNTHKQPLARIAIDRGGTFTDAICTREGKDDIVVKLLSVDPNNYKDAPTEAIRRILSQLERTPIPKGQLLSLDKVESIRMGTTVSTNALLERNGEPSALLTSRGWADVLSIGMQARPDIFDLSIKKLSYLYDEVVEIDERITMFQSLACPPRSVPENDSDVVTETATGESIKILRRPDPKVVAEQLVKLRAKGIKSIAIAFVHSYLWPEHETLVADVARGLGFTVSVSSQIQSMIKLVARANSAIADAYLTPVTRRYIESFSSGFEGGLDCFGDKLLFMQSDGGLCQWEHFSGLRAILSGPAGGVIGYSQTCYDGEDGAALIAVDMGGTSTDVSRYEGKLEHVFETSTAEVVIQAPQLDINTVAAGGGSRLFFRNGMFVVGPESTTAHPGPACYRKGGPLAVTDANLILGRLLPEHFPKIFGPKENESLDIESSRKLFEQMTATINADRETTLSVEEVAAGFLLVANETMCRPIRTLTEARGFESASHHLVIFGGAGGQHGCSIARTLGISRIIIPKRSSVLSAHGIALADVVTEVSEPAAFSLSDSASGPRIDQRVKKIVEKARGNLTSQGFTDGDTDCQVYLNCRYSGTSTQLMIERTQDDEDYRGRFTSDHKREFGFNLDRDIMVDDLRVRAVGQFKTQQLESPYKAFASAAKRPLDSGASSEKQQVYFQGHGWLDTLKLPLESLQSGTEIPAPAIIWDATQTILVEPGYKATSLPNHVIIDLVDKTSVDHQEVADGLEQIDPILLSVYGHRLMGIAEQMGDILRKVSISLNIKERLDYSCAIFSRDGNLVANAPHIPSHLGAMSHAVRHQARLLGDSVKEGDVMLSNHPAAGGSHLPDMTVIMPSFHDGKIVFWTATRAHHADIGGIRAGSMPPFAKEIWEEGAQIHSFKIVDGGKFNEEGLKKIFCEDPARYPGCSGTRTWQDNVSDFHAQVAACHRGVVLINALIKIQSLDVVQFYMDGIMQTAEDAVRDLLRRVHKRFGGRPLEAVDWMDDGSEIRVKITIDEKTGDAVFDFKGTSPQGYSNLNTPTAILFSAIIYVLRSLITADVPLNQGCLNPIKVIVPPGSIVAPSPDRAVCAGNVESSQRVTDVILKAFEACGASQGGCNNLTYGNGAFEDEDGKHHDGFGYYETICGGAGAGPTWDGQHCVHVHMTNTSIGDVEHTERVYPVIVHRFSRRHDSGGAGRHPGGDGCIRDIEFTVPTDVAMVSQRRVIAPYGMAGGGDGQRGRNEWWKVITSDDEINNVDYQEGGLLYGDAKYTVINLGGMNQCRMQVGDHMVIYTPGGGGYGAPGSSDEDTGGIMETAEQKAQPFRAGGSLAKRAATALQN